MRIALKKNFLDTMSCVIMKHRVRDYAKLGLPNARMRGQQQPHAQGGAQNINIVNNIEEDAQQVAALQFLTSIGARNVFRVPTVRVCFVN